MTLDQLQGMVLKRCGEVVDGGEYHKTAEAGSAINEAQRLFCLLTLCLESTANIAVGANAWYSLQTALPNLIVPLRIRIAGAGGTKLEAKRLEELDAIDPNWQVATGQPRRYACLGPDLLAVTPQPGASGLALSATYARGPADLAGAATPEIPPEYHEDLVAFAIWRLRSKEGGEEFQKALPHLDRFWLAAKKMATYVRSRSLAARYDRLPPEESFFDRSRMLDFARKQSRWSPMLEVPQTKPSS
jgi:hypothetical protein